MKSLPCHRKHHQQKCRIKCSSCLLCVCVWSCMCAVVCQWWRRNRIYRTSAWHLLLSEGGCAGESNLDSPCWSGTVSETQSEILMKQSLTVPSEQVTHWCSLLAQVFCFSHAHTFLRNSTNVVHLLSLPWLYVEIWSSEFVDVPSLQESHRGELF